MNSHYVVVLRNGRAEIMETDDPNSVTEAVVGSYQLKNEAEQRRDIENDPHKRALFVAGKLRIRE